MKQLKFECPECGTEFTITANQPKAKERIEALKKAGIDVSNLFAMQGGRWVGFCRFGTKWCHQHIGR